MGSSASNSTRDYAQFTSDLGGLNRQISAACALLFDFTVQPNANGITIKCGSYGEQSFFDVSYTIAVHQITKVGPHGRIHGTVFVKNWSVQFRVVPSSRTVIHQGGEKATLNVSGSGDLRVFITSSDAAVDDAMNKRGGVSLGAFVVWKMSTSTSLDAFGTGTVVLPASMGITGATHVSNNSYTPVSMLETLENHRP